MHCGTNLNDTESSNAESDGFLSVIPEFTLLDPYRTPQTDFLSAVVLWMNFRSRLFQENFEQADFMTLEQTASGPRRTIGLSKKIKSAQS